MTMDIAKPDQRLGSAPILSTLTLVFAGLTVAFALFSMVVGSRQASLHTRDQTERQAAAMHEAASVESLQAAVTTAKADLSATQKALDDEKVASERLKRQLSVVMKDLEKAKAALIIANQTIDQLQTRPPLEAVPAETVPPVSPDPVHPSPELPDHPAPSAAPADTLAPPPASPPATAAPPQNDVVTTLPQTPNSQQPVTEETITPSLPASQPVPAPASE